MTMVGVELAQSVFAQAEMEGGVIDSVGGIGENS